MTDKRIPGLLLHTRRRSVPRTLSSISPNVCRYTLCRFSSLSNTHTHTRRISYLTFNSFSVLLVSNVFFTIRLSFIFSFDNNSIICFFFIYFFFQQRMLCRPLYTFLTRLFFILISFGSLVGFSVCPI